MIDDDDDDPAFDDDDDNAFEGADASRAVASDLDVVTAGAAVDSADDADERLRGLPRILRYTMLVEDRADAIEPRLVAEIEELCPGLPSAMAWATTRDAGVGLALAAELDRLAVTRDLPLLRSLGDCVRLLSLTLPFDVRRFGEFRRVTRVLIMAFDAAASDLQDEQRNDLERLICGWAALPMATGSTDGSPRWPAIHYAARLGEQLAAYRIRSADTDAAQRVRREREQQADAAREPEARTPTRTASPSGPEMSTSVTLPSHHVVVGRMDEVEMRSAKLKDLIVPVKPVLNAALTLVETPPLDQVRRALMVEFPYAVAVVDFALADLIGRPIIKMRPLLLVGEPGGGKSRFARRLSHVNYVATANSLDPLPTPLRDRFRIVMFPKPTIDDLDALLPGLLQAIATERCVDARWIAPLDAVERAAIARHWSGGSIRRLLRILDVVLQARDRHATRQ